MNEQGEPYPFGWYKEKITATTVVLRGQEKGYITEDDGLEFPDDTQDAIVLLAYYIDKAGDDPEKVLKSMGLLKVMGETG